MRPPICCAACTTTSYRRLISSAPAPWARPIQQCGIGMANNYMAIGDTARAQGELAGISQDADADPDYQYLLAEANVLRQEHQNDQALTAFAQASDAAGEDQTTQKSLLRRVGAKA